MITGTQIKMARAALGWGVRDLAAKAGIAANTVNRIEVNGGGLAETLRAIQAALEKGGVEFIAENGGGAGVRLRKRGKR